MSRVLLSIGAADAAADVAHLLLITAMQVGVQQTLMLRAGVDMLFMLDGAQRLPPGYRED